MRLLSKLHSKPSLVQCPCIDAMWPPIPWTCWQWSPLDGTMVMPSKRSSAFGRRYTNNQEKLEKLYSELHRNFPRDLSQLAAKSTWTYEGTFRKDAHRESSRITQTGSSWQKRPHSIPPEKNWVIPSPLSPFISPCFITHKRLHT